MIGNGTASRESEAFVAEVLKDFSETSYVIVTKAVPLSTLFLVIRVGSLLASFQIYRIERSAGLLPCQFQEFIGRVG